VAVEPRPASSVVLIRPGAASAVEAHLIRRVTAMRFLGRFDWDAVVPGG